VVQSARPNFALTGSCTLNEPSARMRPLLVATQTARSSNDDWSVTENWFDCAMPT
jgi:hypothetical protein